MKSMSTARGSVSVETLLKIVLALAAILLAFQVVGILVGWAIRLLIPVFVLLVLVGIVLWLLE